jgi:hypothetical protein
MKLKRVTGRVKRVLFVLQKKFHKFGIIAEK